MRRRRSSRLPTTALLPICSRRCRSSRASCRSAAIDASPQCNEISTAGAKTRLSRWLQRYRLACFRTGDVIMRIRSVGVLGAGQMGNGIAHVCAVAGYDVRLFDQAPDKIEAALSTIRKNLSRSVKSGRIKSEQESEALRRIRPVDSLSRLGDSDLVIETALEDEQVKRKIFADLCPLLKKEAILGTNTSSLSIT